MCNPIQGYPDAPSFVELNLDERTSNISRYRHNLSHKNTQTDVHLACRIAVPLWYGRGDSRVSVYPESLQDP